jgi:DNA-binding CsgD family transcriptional regulator
VKQEKYGAAFLAIIQAYCAEKGIEEVAKTAVTLKPAPQRPSGGKSRMEEVLELFNNGRTVSEIATQFNVKHSTIFSHLWRGVQAGHKLRPGDDLTLLSQLPPDDQQRACAAFAELGTHALRPAYEALGETVSYDELHLWRLIVELGKG